MGSFSPAFVGSISARTPYESAYAVSVASDTILGAPLGNHSPVATALLVSL